MNCVVPITTTLSVTYDGITYAKEYYKSHTLLTGVVDENYPNWSTSTTYGLGDYVIVPELKRIYRSAIVGNIGSFPLASLDTNWIDYGPVNSFRMFSNDDFIGSKTTGTDIVMELDFSQRDTIALIDVDFLTVKIELINTDTSLVVSTKDILGKDIGCFNYADYFYSTDIKYIKRVIVNDLEWLPSSKLKITFTGNVSMSSVVYGTQQELGATLVGGRLRFEDNSKIKVDEISGFRSVIRYGNLRVLDCEVVFDTDDFNTKSQMIQNIIGKNILWIPSKKDRFSESISIGYIEDFELPMENMTKTQTQTRIIGV